jgi:hypothetical protein
LGVSVFLGGTPGKCLEEPDGAFCLCPACSATPGGCPVRDLLIRVARLEHCKDLVRQFVRPQYLFIIDPSKARRRSLSDTFVRELQVFRQGNHLRLVGP